MYIRSLEIVGFKSFPERTQVNLAPGLSAVVGPNGCGKSNIIDAVRWVMGEQSPKTLRGRNMDDVLFNGSQNRPASALAEVTLTMTREADPEAGLGPAETSVARRLYRSGDSEYLINRTPCRLKDIIRFFTDQGVGTRAYGIIEQGRVGWLVDARPEERRGLIDEAAGITGYKQQKKEAERKLLSAADNLENVRVIKAETKKQLDQITRAAAKAARYKLLKDELRELDLVLSARALAEARDRRREVAAGRDEGRRRLSALLTDLELAEVEMENIRLNLGRQEREVEELSAAWHSQVAARDLALKEAEYAAASLDQAEKRRVQALAEAERLKSELGRREADQARLAEEAAGLRSESLSARSEADDSRARWLAGREAFEILSRDLERAEGERAAEEKAAAAQAQKLAGSESLLAHHRERRAALAAEAGRAGAAVRDFEEKKSALAQARAEAAQALDAAAEVSVRGEADRQRAEEDLAAARGRASAGEAALAAGRARLETLKGLRESFGWYPDGVKALMAAPELKEAGLLGPLAEFMEIPDGFEAAAEAGLGERLAWLVARDRAAAAAALDFAEARDLGRCGFICRDELAPDLTRALLGDFQLAENLSAAAPGVCLTRDGRYAGLAFLAGGRPARAAGDEAGLLARLKEVEALAGQVSQASAEAAGLKAAEAAAAEVWRAAVAAASSAAEGRNRASAALAEAERNLALAGQELTQAEKRVLDLAGELAATDMAAEELTSSLALGRAALAETETRAEAARARAEALRLNQREAAGTLEESRQASEEAAARAAAQADRMDRAEHDLALAARGLGETLAGLSARAGEAETLAGELAGLSAKVERLAEETAAWPEKLGRSEAALSEARLRLAEAREKYQARENAARDLRRRREEGQALLSGQETELVKLEARLDRLDEDVRRDWRVVLADPESGAGQETVAGPEPAAPAETEPETEPGAAPAALDILDCRQWAARPLPDEAPARRDALKAKLENLGEVSLGAIEREAELSAEYERYQSQYEELSKAMADLRNGIGRLNHTCRLLFGETFKAVDEKFQEIFPILFEGGQGWLSLTDESDPLESGVEIHVHPPGKKLLVMSLLSGGEKALTALALIFALYLIKPSPFCLLDETDAPLDEANIDRFNRLLRRLSRESQIIMVTHNKRTMQICGTLYGVTMETPGVSRLVSVNLAEAEVMADA
ncbi:MAG: AAA family ATPase [Candidatus Adiutrix sp.]|jgi:chromosome segregation protein|nr:AAA family ATPase [Candidatus Adiutrix sp.]